MTSENFQKSMSEAFEGISNAFKEMPKMMEKRKAAYNFAMELIEAEGDHLNLLRLKEIEKEVNQKHDDILELSYNINVKYN